MNNYILRVFGMFICFNVSGILWTVMMQSKLITNMSKYLRQKNSSLKRAIKAYRSTDDTKTIGYYGFSSLADYEEKKQENEEAIREWTALKREEGHKVSWELQKGSINELYLVFDGTAYKAKAFLKNRGGKLYVESMIAREEDGNAKELGGMVKAVPMLDIKELLKEGISLRYLTSIKEQIKKSGEAMLSLYELAGCNNYREMHNLYSEEEIALLENEAAKSFISFEDLGSGLYLCKGIKLQEY